VTHGEVVSFRLTCDRRDDSGETTEAREHPTSAAAVGRVEKFRSRRIENSVEVLEADTIQL